MENVEHFNNFFYFTTSAPISEYSSASFLFTWSHTFNIVKSGDGYNTVDSHNLCIFCVIDHLLNDGFCKTKTCSGVSTE